VMRVRLSGCWGYLDQQSSRVEGDKGWACGMTSALIPQASRSTHREVAASEELAVDDKGLEVPLPEASQQVGGGSRRFRVKIQFVGTNVQRC
jgi:hypothetical protein